MIENEDNPSLAGRSTLVIESILVLITVVVAPIVLYMMGAAPSARVLYPLSNVLLAGALYFRRSSWYPSHCVLVFCFVSLVRRFADDQGNWDPVNPILFTPYLCCGFSALGFLEYWMRMRPRFLLPLLTLLFCIAYGVILGIAHGQPVPAFVEGLKWAVGPLFAVYLLASAERASDVRSKLEITVPLAGAAMSIYGLFQFIAPAPWDITWVKGAMETGFMSIGNPEPYALRVFSTMNSPGSLGAALTAGVLLSMRHRPMFAVPLICAMAIGLALCQYRTIWAATLLGVILVASLRPGSRSTAVLCAILSAVILAASAAAFPAVRETLGNRAASIANISSDASLGERLRQYRDIAVDNESVALGAGLGSSGTAASKVGAKVWVALDSGILECWRTLGIVVGTLFLCALVGCVVEFYQAAAARFSDSIVEFALVAVTLIQLPMGSIFVGELGFFAWVGLGVGLAAILQREADGSAIRHPAVQPAPEFR